MASFQVDGKQGVRRVEEGLPIANESNPRLVTGASNGINEASHLLRQRSNHPFLSFASMVPPRISVSCVSTATFSVSLRDSFPPGWVSSERNSTDDVGTSARFIVLVLTTVSRATCTSPQAFHERCASTRRRIGRAPFHPTPSEEKRLSSSMAWVGTSQPNVVVGRVSTVSPPYR